MIRPLIACWVLLAFLCAGCDGGTSVRGYIRDTAGSPIAGAKVTLIEIEQKENRAAMSRDDGSFRIAMLHAPSDRVRLRLHVEKDGYVPWTIEFKSALRSPELNIVLSQIQPNTQKPFGY